MNLRYKNRKVKARMLALQALYQWQASGGEIKEIENEFYQNQSQFSKVFFNKLLTGVNVNVEKLDELYEPMLDREIKRLDLVEKTLLRLATFELAFCPENPTNVIINEAVNLAKEFGADKSYKYINAILDKLSQSINRSSEVLVDL